jgi:hypothetical protein
MTTMHYNNTLNKKSNGNNTQNNDNYGSQITWKGYFVLLVLLSLLVIVGVLFLPKFSDVCTTTQNYGVSLLIPHMSTNSKFMLNPMVQMYCPMGHT